MPCRVASRKRCVSWNHRTKSKNCHNRVASRKRCVSWNFVPLCHLKLDNVASRKRCVSWNTDIPNAGYRCQSRISQEMRELKFRATLPPKIRQCRISQEMRELKSAAAAETFAGFLSHLARDAWVEMGIDCLYLTSRYGRISQEMRELKWCCMDLIHRIDLSHLARDAWVEMI